MREIDTRSTVAFAQEQLLRRTTCPIAWEANALALNRAYENLKLVVLSDVKAMLDDIDVEKISITATVLMLGGFVIENLLKGLIAKSKSIPIENGKPRFKHHKLVDLARDAEIPLSTNEKVLLQRLTEFVLWAGRYPAPQDTKSLRGYTLENGGYGTLTSMSVPQDFADTSTMIARLLVELKL